MVAKGQVYCPRLLLTMFESVNEILLCDHSNEKTAILCVWMNLSVTIHVIPNYCLCLYKVI